MNKELEPNSTITNTLYCQLKNSFLWAFGLKCLQLTIWERKLFSKDNLFHFSHSSKQEEKIMFLIFSSLEFEPTTPN